ncbi:MAG: DUF222 domain-containing protein [Rhodoglobus sp.]
MAPISTDTPALAERAALLGALIELDAPYSPPSTGTLSDADLLERQRLLAEVERRVTAASAALAAEVRHRSRPDLGHAGLAQRLGDRTPERLVQRVTGASKARANSLVRVGSMMPSAPPAPERSPWLADVAAAVAAGVLSLDAAEAIRAGLGTPTAEVPSDALALSAAALIPLAATLTVESLAVRAREERLALDLALVVEREAALRERRSLTLYRQPDGMTRLTALLDPESAATITSVFDGITSPRRGGPRFIDADEAARADLTDDARTTEQIALDAFVALLHIGASADPKSLVGGRGPAVQVLVTDHDLRARAGLGFIEGQTEPVSIATVERHICESGVMPVHFDSDGQVVNVGRENRLFGGRQRTGLAARDGGCRWDDCDRPPSWCEAHHIDHWVRDGGRTDIEVGILLCKHHHLLLHNNGWEIEREKASYWLIPPRQIDPEQRRIPMPVKSAAARRAIAIARPVQPPLVE